VEEIDPVDKEEFEEIEVEEEDNLDPDFNEQLDQEVEDWRRKLEQINTENRNEPKIQLPITNDILMAKLIIKPVRANTPKKKHTRKPNS